MNKRGVSDVMHELVKMLPDIVAIILLLGAIVALWAIFFAKEISVESKNFDRVVAELRDLQDLKIDEDSCSVYPLVRKVPLQFKKSHKIYLKSPYVNKYNAEVPASVSMYYFFDGKWVTKDNFFKGVVKCNGEADLCFVESEVTVTAKKPYLTLTRRCNQIFIE